jgi:flavin reductase (DIM6/NTAB) family NADH-FMN oxidoreductase RutF
MSLDPDAFRSIMGRFASGITVVTTRDTDGRDHGLTVSAFCSLSLSPPLVLVSIDKEASMHPALIANSHFAVNILADKQEAVARRFATPETDRFEGIGFSRGSTGAPLLDDVLAYVECRISTTLEGGDHTIFIGEIEFGDAPARNSGPLLYYRGGYAQLSR